MSYTFSSPNVNTIPQKQRKVDLHPVRHRPPADSMPHTALYDWLQAHKELRKNRDSKITKEIKKANKTIQALIDHVVPSSATRQH